jgi:hypothetical protein
MRRVLNISRHLSSSATAASSKPRVLTEVVDGIATVTLNRSEKMNALDLPMFDGIGEALCGGIQPMNIRPWLYYSFKLYLFLLPLHSSFSSLLYLLLLVLQFQ